MAHEEPEISVSVCLDTLNATERLSAPVASFTPPVHTVSRGTVGSSFCSVADSKPRLVAAATVTVAATAAAAAGEGAWQSHACQCNDTCDRANLACHRT